MKNHQVYAKVARR